MAVAQKHIAEMAKIIKKYVPAENIGPLLAELRLSEPGQKNESFKQTIWRLIEQLVKSEH